MHCPLAVVLLAVLPAETPAQTAPPGPHRMVIFNGPTRTVHYQPPPGASAAEASIYRELERSENEAYLSDLLLTLMIEYVQQERVREQVITTAIQTGIVPGGIPDPVTGMPTGQSNWLALLGLSNTSPLKAALAEVMAQRATPDAAREADRRLTEARRTAAGAQALAKGWRRLAKEHELAAKEHENAALDADEKAERKRLLGLRDRALELRDRALDEFEKALLDQAKALERERSNGPAGPQTMRPGRSAADPPVVTVARRVPVPVPVRKTCRPPVYEEPVYYHPPFERASQRAGLNLGGFGR
jgi:hypothetical protein